MEYPAYHYLPEVYDKVVDLTFYDRMIPYLWALIKKYDIRGNHLIDLGCGTGRLCSEFSSKGFQVTGVDISPTMIEYAQKSLGKRADKQCELLNMDILDLNYREKYDMAISIYNSLNYLTTESQLTKAFNVTWKLLKWGGFFLFDMNTITGLRYVVSKTSISREIDTGFIIANGSWDNVKKLSTLQIDFLVHTRDDEYKHIQEKHLERGYYIKKILSLLKKNKFVDNKVFGCFTFKNPQKASRIMVISRKPPPNQLRLKLV